MAQWKHLQRRKEVGEGAPLGDAGRRGVTKPSFEQTSDRPPASQSGLRSVASELPVAFTSSGFGARGPACSGPTRPPSRLKTGMGGRFWGLRLKEQKTDVAAMAASPTPTPRTGEDELLVWASGRERGGAGDRGRAAPGGCCCRAPSPEPLSLYFPLAQKSTRWHWAQGCLRRLEI